MNNDYATSDERIDLLRTLAKEGEEAALVVKYANRLKDYYKKQMLNAVEMNVDKGRIDEAMVEYRVASKFCYMLESAVDTGQAKREALNKILSR